LLVVGQVELQAFGDDALLEFRVEDREGEFDAAEEVALHPVGAGQVDVFLATGVEVEDAVMFEEAPMIERTRMFSDSPGTPGRSAQTPRTIRSIFTPACEASYRALMTSGSSSEFILAMMRPLPPARAVSASAWIAATTFWLQRERRLPQVLQGARLAQAGQLLEDFADVVGDFLVAGQQAEVGIEAGGARVVVAGAEVGVAAQAAFFAADDQQRLGVRLVADTP
jgi:microcompartment protein CcmK/EutM